MPEPLQDSKPANDSSKNPIVVGLDLSKSYYLSRSYSGINRDEDGNEIVPFSPTEGSWRDIPPVGITMLTESWLNWKRGMGIIPKSVNLDGFDYDMSLAIKQVPEVTISKRCSSIYRSSLQLRLAKLKGEIEKETANYTLNESFIRQMDAVKNELESQRKTRSDEDRIKELEAHLNGWNEREVELQANLDKIQAVILAKGIELDEMLKADLSAVEEWHFKLDEIY